MFLLTTLPCASGQSRIEITYPKWCKVCQILWQDGTLMVIIVLFYFYCVVSQANEGHGIFSWCFTYRWFSQKYNAIFVYYYHFNCHLLSFRKSALQEQKVIAIPSVCRVRWATSYVRFFRKNNDRLAAFWAFGEHPAHICKVSSCSSGWETYSSETKAEIYLLWAWVFSGVHLWEDAWVPRALSQSCQLPSPTLEELGWALHFSGCNLCTTK